MADQGRGVQIRYPTSVLAGALKKEGMEQTVVGALAEVGYCRVDKLATLSGQTLADLGRVTKGLGLKDARNVQYIRAALIKLRIEIPPAAVEKSSSSSSLASLAASDASSLTLSERLPTTSSAPRTAPVSNNNPAAAVPTTAAKPSANMTEHERMLLILRDFPMAYEQYVRENGGPSLYPGARAAILAPAGPELAEKEESRPASGAAAGAAAATGAAATSPPRVVVHTSEGAVGLLCGAAGTGEGFSLWNMVNDALGWFGFASDQKQYETVDDIVGDLCASTGLPGTGDGRKGKFNPRVRKSQKARLAPLSGDSSGLSPLTLRPTDWKNRDLAGKHLLEESRRLFCIFAGLTRGDGIPTFNWEFKVTKGRVTVHGAVVPNSPWQAVKSDCIIHADKHRIRKLITDDERSKEYDDGVDSYDVSCQLFSSFSLSHTPTHPLTPISSLPAPARGGRKYAHQKLPLQGNLAHGPARLLHAHIVDRARGRLHHRLLPVAFGRVLGEEAPICARLPTF